MLSSTKKIFINITILKATMGFTLFLHTHTHTHTKEIYIYFFRIILI